MLGDCIDDLLRDIRNTLALDSIDRCGDLFKSMDDILRGAFQKQPSILRQ